MTKTIADVQAKTASSKTEMKKTANLEIQAKEATGRYEALKATTAEGAPIAWFPPKMRTFFADQGIDKVTARLESSADFKQPELSDWIKDTWAIDLPQSEYGDSWKSDCQPGKQGALTGHPTCRDSRRAGRTAVPTSQPSRANGATLRNEASPACFLPNDSPAGCGPRRAIGAARRVEP